IGEDTHYERQFHKPFSVIGVFVGDVDARCAIAADKFLSAVGGHGLPRICSGENLKILATGRVEFYGAVWTWSIGTTERVKVAQAILYYCGVFSVSVGKIALSTLKKSRVAKSRARSVKNGIGLDGSAIRK